MTNSPRPSDITFRAGTLAPASVTTTGTPGTTAFEASLTTPRIVDSGD
ncbi:MAG: hypothetical protein ACRD15_21340 [Vicinamibacterales bacterium]